SSSNAAPAPAAPTPCEATVTRSPRYVPVYVTYSRLLPTSVASSKISAMRRTRPGSPATKTFGAISLTRTCMMGSTSSSLNRIRSIIYSLGSAIRGNRKAVKQLCTSESRNPLRGVRKLLVQHVPLPQTEPLPRKTGRHRGASQRALARAERTLPNARSDRDLRQLTTGNIRAQDGFLHPAIRVNQHQLQRVARIPVVDLHRIQLVQGRKVRIAQ